MKAIRKEPGKAPVVIELRDGSYASIRFAIDAEPGSAMTGPGVRCWCDDDALRKRPRPALNLERPSDGAPIFGTVVVLGEDETGEPCSLDDGQSALWMATLALCGVDGDFTWRAAALADLEPRIHPDDVAAFRQLRDLAVRSTLGGDR